MSAKDKATTPSKKERFESLAGEIEEKFRSEGVNRKDINDAIKWARKK